MLSSMKPWQQAQVQPWPISTKYSAPSRTRLQAKKGSWEFFENFMLTGQGSSRIGLELAELGRPAASSSDTQSSELAGSERGAPSIQYPTLVQQPVVYNLPLVSTSWLKIQKWRLRIFQFEKELKRVAGAGVSGLDRLGLHPLVPLLDNQRLQFLLFHLASARFIR